jgi:hypothetical protein
MDRQWWIDRGYVEELLGPGMYGWRKGPNGPGPFIMVTGTGEHANLLPPANGPFLACLYLGDPTDGANLFFEVACTDHPQVFGPMLKVLEDEWDKANPK